MTKTAARRPVAAAPAGPRSTTARLWDRSPAGLRLFKCTICEHVGAGRVDTTALTCSRCGQIGTAALCAAPRAAP